MKSLKLILSGMGALVLCLLANSASANTYTVGGDAGGGSGNTATFGTLSGATFGGTGIPNVGQITKIGNLVLGLSATQRYENPPLTNDGHGTFQAIVGNDGSGSHPNSNYAKWNFDFYVSGVPTGDTTKLFYGTGPNLTQFIPFNGLNIQDSWNTGMGFLSTAGFNPNVAATDYFALVAYDSAGAQLGYSSIKVDVGGGASSVPDSGTTILMLGVGLSAIGLMSYRKRGAA